MIIRNTAMSTFTEKAAAVDMNMTMSMNKTMITGIITNMSATILAIIMNMSVTILMIIVITMSITTGMN